MTQVDMETDEPAFAFTDTNVFIHCTFFRDVDWARELGQREVVLVLPPVVLEELDKRKWAGARREKERARAVLRALKELGLSVTPVRVRDGVSIMVVDNEPDDAFMAQHRLNPRSADDRLLASSLAFRSARSGARILVLTADTGLSMKAPTRQMEVVMPDDRLELADEPDETERALEAARRELTAARNAAPTLRVAFAGGGQQLSVNMRLAAPFGHAEKERLLSEWQERHPHETAMPESVILPNGVRMDLGPLGGLPGVLSQKEAAGINEGIDGVFGRYRDYLDAWPATVNSIRRCIEISLVLENTGTAPADDVHLEVWTEAEGVWREELPELEEPPAVPRPRGRFDFLLPQVPAYNFESVRLQEGPIDGPNVAEDEPDKAQYTVKRVKHHVPCLLPKVFFQFEKDEDAASFSIKYRLLAANIREPRDGSLNVRITLDEPAPPPAPEKVFAGRTDDSD